MAKKASTNPSVVVLGGSSNALAITRSMTAKGVDVYLSVLAKNCASYTRLAKKIYAFRDKKRVQEFWGDLLLSGKNSELRGSIIFPCSDDAVEFVAKNSGELEKNYTLDESIPDVHLTMLDKRKTMEKARALGIPVPQFAVIDSAADIPGIDFDTLKFPLIVKPQHSHLFQKAFNGAKLFFAKNSDELNHHLNAALEKNLKVIVSEMIPGPDTQLGSYYTYLDKNDQPLFHYTKAVVRRFPKNNGQGCYHITRWNPEVAELGLRFFRGVGLKGLGNVEFKKDVRDGLWKLIECNPRFTAAHELLVKCGMSIDWMIYNHLVGQPVPPVGKFKENMTLWYPRSDWFAYKELKALGELTFGGWLKSIAKPQVLPHFRFNDPMPTLGPFWNSLKNRLARSTGASRQENHASHLAKSG